MLTKFINKKLSVKLNTYILILQNIVSFIIAIFTTRFLIHAIGIEEYGVFTAFSSIVLIFTIFSASSSISIQRFISVGSNNKKNEIIKVLMHGVYVQIIVVVLIIIISILLNKYLYENLFSSNLMVYGDYVFIYTFFLLQFICKVLFTPFEALLFTQQKILYITIITLIEVILKFFVVLMLNDFKGNSLLFLAFSYFLIILLSTSIKLAMIFKIEKIKNIQFRKSFDYNLFKRMIGFSAWTNTGVIGGVINNHAPIFITTYFFGPTYNAAQGLNNQITSQTSLLSNQFLKNANPEILKSEKKIFLRYSNISYFLVLPVAIFIYFNVSGILKIWLNDFPLIAVSIIKVTLINVVINQIMSPCVTILRKFNRIKILEIINLLFQTLPIIASVYFFINQKFEFIYMYYIILFFNLLRLFTVYILINKYQLSTKIDLFKNILNLILPLIVLYIPTLLFTKQLLYTSNPFVNLLVNFIITLLLALIHLTFLKKINKYETT